MSERDIEQPFVKWCKQVGIKVKKKNFADQLDRWLMIPGGAPIIIEFKAPGKKPTPLQQREIDELIKLNYYVGCYSSFESAVQFVTHKIETQIKVFNHRAVMEQQTGNKLGCVGWSALASDLEKILSRINR